VRERIRLDPAGKRLGPADQYWVLRVGSAHVLDKPDARCARRSGAEVEALVTELQAISGS
jgi:hypothetical protein